MEWLRRTRPDGRLPGLQVVVPLKAGTLKIARFVRSNMENHLMKKATKTGTTSSSKPARVAKKPIVPAPPTNSDRPGGKLGLIVDRLSAKSGATADELVKATGWQRHSVLGALSKLKARGLEFSLDAHGDRKAYRLTLSKE